MTGQVLVADIGGTNARLAVATIDASGQAGIDAFAAFRCADFADFDTLLDGYLRALPVARPAFACFAIAGPIRNEVGRLTNSGWDLDTQALAQRFNFRAVKLLNDFGALAYSVPYLAPDEVVALHAAPASAGPISVIGPGTGLGAALLVAQGKKWDVIATEGGHRSFAPTTQRELQIYRHLGGFERHLSAEHLLSGAGIVKIHQTLASIAGQSVPALEPSRISQRALNGSDPLCVEALSIFCAVLGAVAGDTALIQGATGGVYLGGGIAPKIKSLLLNSRFRERFCAKGVMSAYLERIPIRMIDSNQAALKGAALWFSHHANC